MDTPLQFGNTSGDQAEADAERLAESSAQRGLADEARCGVCTVDEPGIGADQMPSSPCPTNVGGAVTVANGAVQTDSQIFLTARDAAATKGTLRTSVFEKGTFVITSSVTTDSGLVAYEIRNRSS